MKIHKEYYDVISNGDTYTTPKSKKGKFIFNPALQFYPDLIKIFTYGNRLTKINAYDRYNWVATSVMIMDGLERVGLKFEITGMDNLKSFDGPAIFIGNHMSALETVVLPRIINPVKKVVFVTKQELNSVPLFGPINSSRHPIIVGRENAREDLMQVMSQGAERLKDGRSIILFPQRTRNPVFDVANFNSLGIKLAKRNNVPVIPIALLTDAWGNGKIVKDFGKVDPSRIVKITFGKPLIISGNGAEQQKEVINFITSHLREWGREEYIKK